MRDNDSLQGILFDREHLVDLRPYSNRQRLIKTFDKTRQQIRKRQEIRHFAKWYSTTRPQQSFAFLDRKSGHDQELLDFNDRFKQKPANKT